MFSISYPADEHYTTPQAAGVPQYENGKQFIAQKRRLVNFYGYNSSGAAVVVAIIDTADGTNIQAGDIVRVFPVPAGLFVSIGQHAGKRMERGIFAKAFTDATLATPAGNVMLWDVDWLAYS